jgi:hypothetical protein
MALFLQTAGTIPILEKKELAWLEFTSSQAKRRSPWMLKAQA